MQKKYEVVIRSFFITECSFKLVFLFLIFVIVILDCFVMIFLFVPSVFLDIVLLLVLILLIFTLDDVLLVITSEMDEGLLVVLFFRIVIWRVRGLLTHELGVCPGAGDAVGAEDAVEVPDNLSLEVDGALDSALVDAHHGQVMTSLLP